jgi:hypothetical protein
MSRESRRGRQILQYDNSPNGVPEPAGTTGPRPFAVGAEIFVTAVYEQNKNPLQILAIGWLSSLTGLRSRLGRSFTAAIGFVVSVDICSSCVLVRLCCCSLLLPLRVGFAN